MRAHARLHGFRRAAKEKHVFGKEPVMSAHALYVTAAYAITAILLAGLIGWVLLDQRARKRELAELEAAGIRRRSDKAAKPRSTP